MEIAVSVVAWALEIIGVKKYGIIGGEAISIYSSRHNLWPRQTEDIDLIVQPDTFTAEVVSSKLTTNEAVKGYFISKREGYVDKPHVIVRRGTETMYVPVEIFDWQVWPEKREYFNLDREGNTTQSLVVNDQQTHLLSPGWLLHQKILTYSERQNRARTDLLDIHSLAEILARTGEIITIIDEVGIESLKKVLRTADPPDLESIVRCEAIWPTQWTWDAEHESYYRYDESWEKVWRKGSE